MDPSLAPRRNEHGQPIGEAVAGWEGARIPTRVPLTGEVVRLEPVTEAQYLAGPSAATPEV